MKLAEALSIVTKAPADAKALPVTLVCGFTPLHFQNYLAAHLQVANPARKVLIETGLFGDTAGNLEKFAGSSSALGVLALEWQDLDPRLGYRHAGGWGPKIFPAVLQNAREQLNRLGEIIERVPAASRLVVSVPTLDLPPAFQTTGFQASEAELALARIISDFAARIAPHPAILLVNHQTLANLSPSSARYDFRADLNTGFPYTQPHADVLAKISSDLLRTPEPKKGLITDLDDTLWLGLVGEIGADQVSWDLASHSQLHGLYQQMVSALAEQGVLVGIASKNSPEVVGQALLRDDLLLNRDKVFPIEVHWEPKSGSVTRILQAWNISADSVVFVDDSPMELAEVKALHPAMECLLFPKTDYPAALAFLKKLRDLFGKPRLSEEDSFRLQSLRQGQQFTESAKSGSANDLLASAEAVLTIEITRSSLDKRGLELVNKTNQFNLNGNRFTEAEWMELLSPPSTFAGSVSYQDRFGPLGKIAAFQGVQQGDRVHLNSWVLSCRAFSRHIEHRTLEQLFLNFDAKAISFNFIATAKNRPMADFLAGVSGQDAASDLLLGREQFIEHCPKLFHQVFLKNE